MRLVSHKDITPAQAAAIKENDPDQAPMIIALGFVADLRKIRGQPLHLLIFQPIQAIMFGLPMEPKVHRNQPIDASFTKQN